MDNSLLDRVIAAYEDASPVRGSRTGMSAALDLLAAEVICRQQLEGRMISGDEVARFLLDHQNGEQ